MSDKVTATITITPETFRRAVGCYEEAHGDLDSASLAELEDVARELDELYAVARVAGIELYDYGSGDEYVAANYGKNWREDYKDEEGD